MINMEIEDGIIENTEFYFIERYSNNIFRINLLDGKINHVSNVPGDIDSIFGKGLKLKKWKNKFVVSPGCDCKIWIYDRAACYWEFIKIELKHQIIEPLMHMFCAEIKENVLYLFGCRYPGIVICNLSTFDYKEIPYSLDICKEPGKTFILRYGLLMMKDKIYGISVKNSKLCDFDIKEEKDKWVSYSDDKEKNSDFVNYVVSRFDYITMQQDNCIFWHKYEEGVLFQNRDYKLHFLPNGRNEEMIWKVELDSGIWQSCQDVDYLRKRFSMNGSILMETERCSLNKFITEIKDSEIYHMEGDSGK